MSGARRHGGARTVARRARQLGHERSERRTGRPLPSISAKRSGRASRPTASQSPAIRRHAARRSRSSATAQSGTTTRVAPAAKASSICSGPSTPPASCSGVATARAMACTAAVFTGRRPPRRRGRPGGWPVPRLHEVTRDALGSIGRRAGAPRRTRPEDQPRTSGLEVDAGDDLHQPPAGSAPGRARLGRRPSPASSRRWKLTGMLPA